MDAEAIDQELMCHAEDGLMPSREHLLSLGRGDLVAAISREAGGVSAVAARNGLALSARQAQADYSAEMARRDVAKVVRAEGYLPGINRLTQLGWTRLAGAVRRAGGASALLQALEATGVAVDGRKHRRNLSQSKRS
jgi:hypothetical protein